MAGTKEGAIKSRNSNLEKDPDYYKKLGYKGGKSGKGPGYQGGFAHPNSDPVSAGKVGGKISRRYGPVKKVEQ